MKKIFLLIFLSYFSFITKAQTDYDVSQYFTALLNAKNYSAQKQWKNAISEWEKVLKINPLQASAWNNLATAYYQEKDYQKAILAYQKTYELGFYIPQEALYNIAACYAMLGDRENALRYLEQATPNHPSYRRYAQEDPEFAAFQNDAAFKKIVGKYDASKLSRLEGWQSDLDLFASEYKKVHYAPFQKISEKDFDHTIATLKSKISQFSDVELCIELLKLLRRAADAHSAVYYQSKTALPLQFYIFEEGTFITSTEKEYSELLGSQVLKIEASSMEQVIAAIDPIVALDGSNEQQIKVLATHYLRIPAMLQGLHLIKNTEKVSLTIKDTKGNTKIVEVKAKTDNLNIMHALPNPEGWVSMREKLSKIPLYLQKNNQPYWFEYLESSKTVYLQYNSVRNDPKLPFKDFLKQLSTFMEEKKAEKLVIDLRWNNGGNTYLLPPLLEAIMQNKNINQKGKLFGIIGRRTFSAAQNCTSLLERFTNITLVGEPTGSSPNFIGEDGSPIVLPYSQLYVNFSNLYWQSSTPTDNRGFTAPEILLPPRFKDYSIGKDRCLEAILGLKSAGK